MRRPMTVVSSSVAGAAIVALGIAVAGLASSSSSSGGAQSTSETTTTEAPKTTKHRAALTVRAEVPGPKGVRAGVGGAFKLDLTDSSGSYSIAWTLTYRNLTGRAQAAHIHKGRPGKAGPVIVGLCGPCSSGRKGKAKVSKTVASAIRAGTAYVNVHTATNAAGEIRGQVKKAS